MRKPVLIALLAGVLLAGCGVDGPPEPVEPRTPGVSVSGTVEIGVTGSL